MRAVNGLAESSQLGQPSQGNQPADRPTSDYAARALDCTRRLALLLGSRTSGITGDSRAEGLAREYRAP